MTTITALVAIAAVVQRLTGFVIHTALGGRVPARLKQLLSFAVALGFTYAFGLNILPLIARGLGVTPAHPVPAFVGEVVAAVFVAAGANVLNDLPKWLPYLGSRKGAASSPDPSAGSSTAGTPSQPRLW